MDPQYFGRFQRDVRNSNRHLLLTRGPFEPPALPDANRCPRTRWSIDDHLRRIDAAQSETAGVGVLAIAEKARGVGIGPANVVPVIHVLAEYDQLRPSDGLRTIKLLQQRVGRRATRATFGGKKLNQHRRGNRGLRRVGRGQDIPAIRETDIKINSFVIPANLGVARSIARCLNGCAPKEKVTEHHKVSCSL